MYDRGSESSRDGWKETQEGIILLGGTAYQLHSEREKGVSVVSGAEAWGRKTHCVHIHIYVSLSSRVSCFVHCFIERL